MSNETSGLSPYLQIKRVDGAYQVIDVRSGEICSCDSRGLRFLRALSGFPGGEGLLPPAEAEAAKERLAERGFLTSSPSRAEGTIAPRVALATTVRDTGPSLFSFIRYHLALGFSRIFIFFDDPADPLLEEVGTIPRVTATRADERLYQRYQRSLLYTQMGPQLRDEVMARQILNAEIALDMASSHSIDWLVHLDSDELFWFDGPVSGFFGRLPPEVGQVNFLNLEAFPEQVQVGDCFREVTLFKEHPFFCEDQAVAQWLQSYRRGWHYLGYSNGKSAVRVVRGALPGSVHNFIMDDRWLATRTLFPVICHYINCGFDVFKRKYQLLGRFSDEYWGRSPRHPFHTASRDVVLARDEEAALRFYERHVLGPRDEELRSLIDAKLVCRSDFAARLLSATMT